MFMGGPVIVFEGPSASHKTLSPHLFAANNHLTAHLLRQSNVLFVCAHTFDINIQPLQSIHLEQPVPPLEISIVRSPSDVQHQDADGQVSAHLLQEPLPGSGRQFEADGVLRGVAYEEVQLADMSQGVVWAIVEESETILDGLESTGGDSEGESVLFVEYRPCFGVDFAVQEEDVDQRRGVGWLDAVGFQDLIPYLSACDVLGRIHFDFSCAAQTRSFVWVAVFVPTLHTFIVFWMQGFKRMHSGDDPNDVSDKREFVDLDS